MKDANKLSDTWNNCSSTGTGITDSELLERAVKNAKPSKTLLWEYKWETISRLFDCNEFVARELSKRFKFNPDEMIRDLE